MKGGSWVKKYYLVQEVAGMFGVTTRTVRNWINEDRTPLQILPQSRPIKIETTSVEIFKVEGFKRR